MTQRSLDDIEALTRCALEANGATRAVAASVAKAVRVAEGYGNKICGLYYVESYCLQLRSGRVSGTVEPDVFVPKPTSIVVDAGYGFAQPAFDAGLKQALAAVENMGTASLAIRRAHTCTSLGYFTEQIAQAGYIGFGFTNASPIVAPPGGKTRMIGTNPIAFSVPDGMGGVAMHVDQSTTTVALGKITMAKALGQSIPLGWALDKEGRPTTDPEAALQGSLTSVGEHKGWGFGLIAEVLAAGMAASSLSRDVKPLKAETGPPHNLGQFYILIDPSTSDEFRHRIVNLAKVVAMDDGARLPGQYRRSMSSVEVIDPVWSRLQELAEGP